MIKLTSTALLLMTASAAIAEETRQLGAHEHGVGQLDIAFDAGRIAMELHAPGADIVGFEYAAKTASDRAAIDAAVARLARPLDLFTPPAAAGCSVVQAAASLESDDHEDEGDDHAEHGDDHKDHDHAEHEDAVGHTEFHASYLLDCADIEQASMITFAYFAAFPNAVELEVQVITERGATAFEVLRDAPTLDLRDMF